MERSNLESAWVRLAGPAAPSTFTMDSNQVGLPSLGAKIRMVPSTVYGAEGSSKGGLRAILADEAWGGLFGPTHMAGAEPHEVIVGSPQKARPQCALLRLRVQVEE